MSDDQLNDWLATNGGFGARLEGIETQIAKLTIEMQLIRATVANGIQQIAEEARGISETMSTPDSRFRLSVMHELRSLIDEEIEKERSGWP